ncbi:helix-turn-helix domain-containing protein [Kribbella sp. NBC_01245]|uniref:IclR family transcriptional regulator n=1 Tax=Kribbella sp. NBC_01245 TaxID=2903578 RepID=UPI002E2CE8E4|nr:helix-turn-helix domain-containing protein [Kribbella sp. NBC_01245]
MGEVVAGSEARGTLGTVRNAVLLLELLSEGQAHQQLTDLAERSGLSVPTVHRLLRSLVLADLVEQDYRSARYGLGPGVTRLSHRYLARLPILSGLSPYLLPLRDAIGATVQVAVLVRGSVVYVDQVDGAGGGIYRDSHRVTGALSTAAGRVLAAAADEEAWRQLTAAAAPADRKIAEAERGSWRAAAYLVTPGGGAAGPGEVAVPVLDSQGRVLAALAATLPPGAPPGQAEQTAEHLSRTALAAGRAVGHG